MTFGKRQLLVGALVVALGAAVYLNWQFSGTKPVEAVDSSQVSSSKELGQTVYVNTEVSGETRLDNGKSGGGGNESAKKKEAAVPVNSDTNDYFSSEKRRRDQARDEAIKALQEVAESDEGSDSAKQEAVRSLEKLSSAIKSENGIETEVRTKGFSDCIAIINNETCTVIVPSGGLNDATAVTIKDIVNRQCAVSFENITITPYKG